MDNEFSPTPIKDGTWSSINHHDDGQLSANKTPSEGEHVPQCSPGGRARLHLSIFFVD